MRIGDTYASGFLPGAETARIVEIRRCLHMSIKYYYLTTDGAGGKDTLYLQEFKDRYPVLVRGMLK